MKILNPNKFCYYPFTQMVLLPTGQVLPCCYQYNMVLGQVPKQGIEEIWNGEEIRQLRREFLEGKPVLCEKQMRHIQCHMFADPNVWKDKISLSEVQKQAPRRLDVRLGGKCNLSCIMCDVWTQPNGLYNSSDFWTYGPEKIFPFLVEIDVLGGEPFIQSDTYRLMNEISKVNEECKWTFVTNASYKFNDTIRKHLDRILMRCFTVSLDSIRTETYAKIRIGGHLEKTLKALDDLIAYRNQRQAEQRGFGFNIAMCVQKDNWQEIGEFIQFVLSKGVHPVLQFAYGPSELSLLTLSKEQRMGIVEYLEGLVKQYGEDILRAILLPMKESLQ